MTQWIIHVKPVSMNSPKHRVQKGPDGLWHVFRFGEWFGATSNWDRAIEWAQTGRVEIP